MYDRASYGGEACKLVVRSLQQMGESSRPGSIHSSRIWSEGKGSMAICCELSCNLMSSMHSIFLLDIHLAHLVGSHIISELMIGGKETMSFILSHPKIYDKNPPCSSKSYNVMGL